MNSFHYHLVPSVVKLSVPAFLLINTMYEHNTEYPSAHCIILFDALITVIILCISSHTQSHVQLAPVYLACKCVSDTPFDTAL